MTDDHWLLCERGLLGKAIESHEIRSRLKPEWFSHSPHIAVAAELVDLHQQYPVGWLTDGVRYNRLLAAVQKCGLDHVWINEAQNAAFLGAGDWREDILRPVVDHTRAEQLRSAAFTLGDPEREGKSADELEASLAAVIQDTRAIAFKAKPTIQETVNSLIDTWEQEATGMKQRGIPTGIRAIDSCLLYGMTPGSVHIIAARPSVGKTSLALQIALNAAIAEHPVLFVSLEMDQDELVSRCLCNLSQVQGQDMHTGNLVEWQQQAVQVAVARLCRLPITFACEDCSTLLDVEGLASATPKPSLVVVDYLGLLQTTDKTRSRYEQITHLSVATKAMARRLKVPVVMLAQLNRDSEKQNRQPGLADLRDSGSIEQDADTVILLHSSKDTPDNQLELSVAKNRSGPTGFSRIKFNRPCFLIEDLQHD